MRARHGMLRRELGFLGTLICAMVLIGLSGLSGCALGGRASSDDAALPPVLYPQPPQQSRIQFLAGFSSLRDLAPRAGSFRRFILGDEPSPGLAKPYGLAMHDGKLLVCDTRAGSVVVFDLVAHRVSSLGADGPGSLAKPINIVIGADGKRYVADAELNRILIYDANDRFLTSFGDPEAWKPSDVALFEDRLYVTDVKGGEVYVLDRRSGQEIARIGTKGSNPGQLFFPTNIAVDTAGNIYVSDTGNFRVQMFDANGELLQQFGSLGHAAGQFARPKGIAVDREGRLYVVDTAFENIQLFDREGDLLLDFGGAGNQRGGMNVPAKVALSYSDLEIFADRVAPGFELEYLILVSSQFGRNKVNVYGFLQPLEGSLQ